ncbi:MAG TPA: hypothetical protein VE967_01480 [Gemmatimonadaceae bacterium]|nr:hypothetical protein [Gemmatimonadaceae bacterium]
MSSDVRERLQKAIRFAMPVAALSCGGGGDSGTSTPVTTPPVPAAVAANSATALSGTVGGAVGARPSVKVTSSSGAPVASVQVAFVVTAGGGSVTGATVSTDASGIATVGSWTLGPAAGTHTLEARVASLTPVVFTATAVAAPLTLTISPTIAAAAPLGSASFTASGAVAWSVNGVAGGSQTLGTISPTGVYTAPSAIPADSVVLTAALVADASVQRSATVFFVPDATTRDYYRMVPRVVDNTNAMRTRFLLVPPANVTAVSFVPVTGSTVALTPIGANAFTFTLEPDAALAGYVSGALRNFVGRLDYRDAGGAQVKLTNVSVNVRDGTMPAVAVTSLAPDVQRSPYILNIRLDSAIVYPSAPIVSRALQLLGGDQFDFVAVIANTITVSNRIYIGLRNDITGIGATTFNNSAAWGGAGKLRGAIAFPIDGLFDGAEQGFMHEVAHSWINYATNDPLLAPGPHWPLSTMANGTMGFNIAGSNVGGNFPYTLTPLGNGTVRVNQVTQSDLFTPLDLYLMGLMPPEEVPPMYILAPSVTSVTNNQVLPATTYTIQNYITNQGARVPSSATAPKQFSAAVAVISFGRLLNASEMAFFDRAAARAETTTPLQSQTGLVLVTASGFFTATGGRATMRTRLP